MPRGRHYTSFQNPVSGWDTEATYEFGRLHIRVLDNHVGMQCTESPENWTAYKTACDWAAKLDGRRLPTIQAAIDALEAAGVPSFEASDLAN